MVVRTIAYSAQPSSLLFFPHFYILLLEQRLRSGERSGEAVLGGDALDTVEAVDVLVEGDHVASSSALAGGNNGGSQEVLPRLRHN